MSQASPLVTININSAQITATPEDQNILVVGQLLSAGSATPGALVEDIISEESFITLFGAGSDVAKTGRAIIRALSISRIKPKVNAIGLSDDGSGVDAEGEFDISGTATAAGTLTFNIDGKIQDYNTFPIAIAVGDTATAVGAALVAAIVAKDSAVVTSSNATGTVTLTAKNAGTIGNTIGIELVGSVAGITVALTAFASGATNPALTTLFDPVVDIRQQTVVYPESWGVSTLTDFLEPRFNVDGKILDGVGYVSKFDTFSTANTTLDALNQRTLVYIPETTVATSIKKGGAIFESGRVITGVQAAFDALRVIPGSNVAPIVTNNLNVGGFYYNAIPYHNTPFNPHLSVIPTGEGFTDVEAKELENSGGFLLRNNPGNTVLIANEAVTTYKTDSLAQPDPTFKFLNSVRTLTTVREFIVNNVKSDFSQHSLTTGVPTPGLVQVSKQSFIAKFGGYYDILSGPDYGLLRLGANERKAFLDVLSSVVFSLVDGKITGDMISNIVTQLREVIISMTPTFET